MFVCSECGHSQPAAGFCTEHGRALESSDDELIGTTLGSYRIARLIGRGGMGAVYLGVHPGIGSRVAIKVLTPESSSSSNLVERFFSEARAVNVIRNENIVNVIDFKQLPDGRPYIIMEYLEGAPLSAVFQNYPQLPLGFLSRLAGDVLDGLSAAHANGIVHRDLKPDNVFVTAGGRAKVLDFGIAKLKGDLSVCSVETRAGSLLGTPQYMSPEQARGQPVDQRSDIYSFGVILFEGIAGRRPFDASTLYDLLRHHIEDRPPTLSSIRTDVPPAIEAVVNRTLEKDPALRFQSAAELAQGLAQAAQFLPPQAWNPPTANLAGAISATLRSPGGTPIASASPFAPRTPIGITPSPLTPAPTLGPNTSTGGAAFDSPRKKSSAPWIALVLGGGFVLVLIVVVVGIAVVGFASSNALDPAKPPPPGPNPTLPTSTGAPVPAPITTAPPDDKPLAGRYKIASSNNPGQSGSYNGYATLADKPVGVHTIHWDVTGSPSFEGIGLIRGNAAGFGWSTGNGFGVAVYDVAGGKLTGRRAQSGKTGVGSEDLEGPNGLDGRYTITAARAPESGATYLGSVEIHPKGSAYDVTWAITGAESTRGVGILDGNTFVVGWGIGDGGVIVYRISGTNLDGRWALLGGSELGSEKLRRQ